MKQTRDKKNKGKKKEKRKKGITRNINKNAREAHRPAPSSPSEAYWAILLSFIFTYTVQTRPCTNEALEGYGTGSHSKKVLILKSCFHTLTNFGCWTVVLVCRCLTDPQHFTSFRAWSVNLSKLLLRRVMAKPPSAIQACDRSYQKHKD